MRNAFIAAINAYPAPHERLSCLNDAVDLQATLQNTRGFTSFVTLLDDAATRSAILAQLQALVSGAVSGDSIMAAFLGHGTPGSGICPVDTDMITGENVIWDHEIAEILADKPMGVKLDVLLGCCYSSTGTRSIAEELPHVDKLQKFKERMPKATKLKRVEPVVFPDARQNESRVIVGMNHCLFAASSGLAYDCISGGLYRGLHTVWWCYVIRNAPTWTRAQIHAYVAEKVKISAPSQNPTVEGNSSKLALPPFL